MKVIRIFCKHDNKEFCVDRPFDNDKSDQENCNMAMDTFVASMSKGTVVPALLRVPMASDDDPEDQSPRTEHVFANLGLMAFITIMNVVVYDTEKVSEK